MRILFSDYEVQADYLCENGNIDTILDLKIKGGGGTSFKNPLDYVKEKYPTTRFVIFCSDGYADKIDANDYPFSILWILSNNGTDENIKDTGEIIKLE